MILNVRHDPGKLLEENTGKTFSDVNHIDIFFRLVSQSKRNRSKNKTIGT